MSQPDRETSPQFRPLCDPSRSAFHQRCRTRSNAAVQVRFDRHSRPNFAGMGAPLSNIWRETPHTHPQMSDPFHPSTPKCQPRSPAVRLATISKRNHLEVLAPGVGSQKKCAAQQPRTTRSFATATQKKRHTKAGARTRNAATLSTLWDKKVACSTDKWTYLSALDIKVSCALLRPVPMRRPEKKNTPARRCHPLPRARGAATRCIACSRVSIAAARRPVRAACAAQTACSVAPFALALLTGLPHPPPPTRPPTPPQNCS